MHCRSPARKACNSLTSLDSLDIVRRPRHNGAMVRRAARGSGEDRADHQLAIRVPAELIDAIDEEVERLRLERPGSKVQRSDAVREILYLVLIAEASFAEAAAKRRNEARREKPKRVG